MITITNCPIPNAYCAPYKDFAIFLKSVYRQDGYAGAVFNGENNSKALYFVPVLAIRTAAQQ